MNEVTGKEEGMGRPRIMGQEVDSSERQGLAWRAENCGRGVRRFRSRPSPAPPTSTGPTTLGGHGADEQLRSAPGPPRRGQHGQCPGGALAHEQSHFAVDPTLMQPEPASRWRAARPARSTLGNEVLN